MAKCKETGCTRQSASGSDFCRICGSAHQNIPQSLAENIAQIRKKTDVSSSQQPFGLLGQNFNPHGQISTDNYPAYCETTGEHIGRFIGPTIGAIAVLAVLVFMIMNVVMTDSTIRSSARKITETQQRTNPTSKSSSHSDGNQNSSSQKSQSSSSGYDKREVDLTLWCSPDDTTDNAANIYYLNLSVGESGTVWVNVEGISDYYIKWDIKPFASVADMMSWNRMSNHKISVWSSTSIYFTGSRSGEEGRNVIRAELYDTNGILLKTEKLCVSVR